MATAAHRLSSPCTLILQQASAPATSDTINTLRRASAAAFGTCFWRQKAVVSPCSTSSSAAEPPPQHASLCAWPLPLPPTPHPQPQPTPHTQINQILPCKQRNASAVVVQQFSSQPSPSASTNSGRGYLHSSFFHAHILASIQTDKVSSASILAMQL